jgi:ADP-heptose:LPS heptosyltransferase
MTSLQDIRRMLVVRAGALGDCLLMLPTLTALRGAFPQARLDVMGHPERWAWVVGRGLVDAVHAIEQPGMHLLFGENTSPPASLASLFSAYDLILAYRPDPEGLFARHLRQLGARLVLSHPPLPPPPPPTVHVADFALQALAPLGLGPPPATPPLRLSAEELALVQPFFAAHHLDPQREPLVVLHPGSGSAAKRWPLARFAELIETVAGQARVRCVAVAGYAEAGLAAELRARSRRAQPLLAEQWPLLPTAALIAHAAVFIGNDSGLTHLAAALGRPTVAIFGPTDPEVWGPRGPRVTIVRGHGGQASAAGLPSDERRAPGFPEVPAVVQAVQRWLEA